jgi:hypothetical protein
LADKRRLLEHGPKESREPAEAGSRQSYEAGKCETAEQTGSDEQGEVNSYQEGGIVSGSLGHRRISLVQVRAGAEVAASPRLAYLIYVKYAKVN